MNKHSREDILALREALDDTCRAWATYDQVVSDFGPVEPFSRLRDVAARHMKALESLFLRYGLQLPNTRCREPVPHFSSPTQAFAAAIAAEIDYVKVYERLHASAREPELLAEICNLLRASRDGHLPALREYVKPFGRHKNAVARQHDLHA